MTKEKFKASREAKKITQEDFAKALGVHQSRVSDWESGKRRIPLYIERLVDALGNGGPDK